MTIYPNLFIPFPWDFITLYFPLEPLVYFGHCGKAQRSSYCILGALTLTRPIVATSVICQGLTPSLGIKLFDKDWERRLPGFLLVIRLLAEPLWIHAEFSCHLDVSVRKMISFPGIDPNLIAVWNLLLFCHANVFSSRNPPRISRRPWR